jgi:hypothetical protein
MSELAADRLLDFPLGVFAFSLIVQCLAAYAGHLLRPSRAAAGADWLTDLDIVHSAALTLLALVIGFTFSMAATRYDQRKNLEAAEANAIGTEYVRTDLLPGAAGSQARATLRAYVEKRIEFYVTRDNSKLGRIDTDTAALQERLWSVVSRPPAAQQTLLGALAVGGMNDVLNSQGYTQAAWLNRIPAAAWVFLELMAIICNLLLGYRFRGKSVIELLILPAITAISFFVISDIDTPRMGVIAVIPQNLILVSQTMKP